MKRRLIALTLALALMLALCAPALAWDYHDFCQYPLADGDVTVSVITRRDDVSGTDIENIWFWQWITQATGINFEVEQVLGSAMEERKSLLFASGDLPDLIYGFGLSTIDLVKYGISPGELKSILNAVGLDALIDQKHPDAALLNYLAYDGDKAEKLLDNPKLLKTPIVRNGKQATVGYCPEVWETWS